MLDIRQHSGLFNLKTDDINRFKCTLEHDLEILNGLEGPMR